MTENFVNSLRPFHVMEILAEAKALEGQGHEICHLEVGEPAMPPAPEVIAATKAVLDAPQGYTHSKGFLELRKAICGYYAAQHDVSLDPERVIVTTGSSAAFVLAFLGAYPPGSTIAVTRPGYPAYLNILEGLGLKPVEIALQAENGWRLSAAEIEAAYKEQPFDGLLFASPANPTGAVVDGAEMAAIVEVCRKLGVQFISDEIYHGLDYHAPSVSALEFGGDAIVINSFSKYYCMTGWRVGWMVLPEALVRRVEILQQNMFISAPTLSQVAAREALSARAYGDVQKERYARNRETLNVGLSALGFEGAGTTDGAFYIYVDASKFTNDSLNFCKRMLREAGVAATPGVDFDRLNGHRFVRFSYAGSEDTMREALKKMAGFLPRP